MADEGSTRPGTNAADDTASAEGAAGRARPSRVDLRRAGLIAAVLTGVAIVALVSVVVVTRRSAVGGATAVVGPGVTGGGGGGGGGGRAGVERGDGYVDRADGQRAGAGGQCRW
ncbi:MAG: hypothetical protein MUE97_05615 [Phycisphaerales bacterium]|nr:hypothetical protein [Phycisphaerales bacterium]